LHDVAAGPGSAWLIVGGWLSVLAALLHIAIDTPLLASERVSFTYGDKPVELRRGQYLTERHHYHNELN
jgi:hypothetical protein